RDAGEWARQTVIARDEPIEPDDFIVLIGQERLPYNLSDGRKQFMRCYVVKSPGKEGEFSVFWHGPHTIMDGRPTINAFSLMFEWLAQTTLEPLDVLHWGTEWKNLPVGPVTATGGPRANWETDGVALLIQAEALGRNLESTHGLTCQRQEVVTPGKVTRLRVELSEEDSAQLLGKCKASGFTATHLFEAATALATFTCNPVPEDNNVHIAFPNIISLTKFQVPPHNKKTHFISSLNVAPMKISYRDIPISATPQDRLLAAMQKFKDQYASYMENVHLPHLFAMQMFLTPPRVIKTGPNACPMIPTNLGIIEHSVAVTYYPDGDHDQLPVLDVLKIAFGHRLTEPIP
ncbi:hypothetical protein B0H21DRAFT_701472, partial [Amylocystis lapponica]